MGKLNTGLKIAWKLLTSSDYRFHFWADRGIYRKLSDEEYLKRLFYSIMGNELNLENPRTFNEKIQWLKLYDRKRSYTVMVDKYRVREYIADKIGSEYLIPLIGVWDWPDEIDFDALPDQFAMKCNHNSGLGMCICTDKSRLDIEKVKKQLRRGLKQNYYLTGREWPYKDVPRKIIAEHFMGENLMDYKIHCFNGEPRFVLVCSDRFSADGLKEDFYDTNWNLMDLHRPKHPNSKNGVERPRQLEQLLEYAKKLAKDIPFVRVDFYIVDSHIYFGEMTFFPASGFEAFAPAEWDAAMGSWLTLPTEASYL